MNKTIVPIAVLLVIILMGLAKDIIALAIIIAILKKNTQSK